VWFARVRKQEARYIVNLKGGRGGFKLHEMTIEKGEGCTLLKRSSQPSARSFMLLWNSGCSPTLRACACVQLRSQPGGTSAANMQFSRAIPTSEGCMSLPEGMGTDVWLSRTNERYLQIAREFQPNARA